MQADENEIFSIPRGKLYINGGWKDSQNGRTFPTTNPATEEEVIKIAEASEVDVNSAIQAARNAFDNGPWPKLSGHERGHILYKIGDLILKHGAKMRGCMYNNSYSSVARN